ncbi:hypothetical protein F4776DRAFT_631473 [Hypoxylon sp. NC0597]|nr:hypothetical protein F4776DRAFT_631473 [Hypoxylon sp. NC0597]
MGKAEFQNWWRTQTAHPSRYQPTVPICPCAACFNGTGHGQEVFRDPIDPGEILPPKKEKLKSKTTTVEKPKEKQDGSKTKPVKKPWYKQAGSLARKPSTASIASDLIPLWAASTTQLTRRTSSEIMS